ncbi:MAG: hypothetical protein HLUCCO07_11990 [Rhodobacteraceae bacterium HLUCCO07]|nr:MAG: hypothetical protein HLUCCO07_11990 [Rhodobacteraceae bacterium HLUCCO07]
MRSYSPATASYLLSRAPVRRHVLVWITARDRATGEPAEIGFWTGDQDATFTIGGENRVYHAAGELLDIRPLTFRTGLKVRTQKIAFSQVAPAAQQAIRGYDARHAPIAFHRAIFHPETDQLLAEPHIVLRGFVNRAPILTPKKGGAGKISLEIATAARALTIPLSRKRSHAALIARSPGDSLRKYASQADKVETPWGKAGKSDVPGSGPAPARSWDFDR